MTLASLGAYNPAMYSPGYEEFARLAAKHNLVPVYRTLLADSLTPVTAFRKIEREEHAFLFESVIGNEKIGRNSFIGSGAAGIFTCRDGQLVVSGPAGERRLRTDSPLAELNRLVADYSAPLLPGLPPFTGGLVGYAAYDAVRYGERLPDAPADDLGLPDLMFMLFDRLLIFDHINKTVKVLAHARLEGKDPRVAYDEARARVDELVARLQGGEAAPLEDFRDPASLAAPEVPSNFSRADFMRAVERCQEYIKAGDIFQVVLSQRFASPTLADPFETYRALRVINPSPYMFYLKAGETILVGSSPEVMVRVDEGRVMVRPIAGTRRRGKTEAEDRALAEELLADPKEIAEHVMLLDLGRNDVGRISTPGSVRIDEQMVVERYSHVMHISSQVSGQLNKGLTALDALQACLPAGTVSGAPKIRAMEIIDEFEPQRRGPYAGCVGYLGFNDNLDTCITIRTILFHKGQPYVQAGAGIVADSRPDREYEETASKARGLLLALEAAGPA